MELIDSQRFNLPTREPTTGVIFISQRDRRNSMEALKPGFFESTNPNYQIIKFSISSITDIIALFPRHYRCVAFYVSLFLFIKSKHWADNILSRRLAKSMPKVLFLIYGHEISSLASSSSHLLKDLKCKYSMIYWALKSY